MGKVFKKNLDSALEAIKGYIGDNPKKLYVWRDVEHIITFIQAKVYCSKSKAREYFDVLMAQDKLVLTSVAEEGYTTYYEIEVKEDG